MQDSRKLSQDIDWPTLRKQLTSRRYAHSIGQVKNVKVRCKGRILLLSEERIKILHADSDVVDGRGSSYRLKPRLKAIRPLLKVGLYSCVADAYVDASVLKAL